MRPLHKRWTLAEIKQAAANFQHRSDFRKGAPNAYACACRNGLLSAVCAHMTPKSTLKWTVAKLASEAKKYQTRMQFFEGSGNAYHAAASRKLLDTVCAHMGAKGVTDE